MSVRFAVLGLLAQRPRHGYELHSAFVALAGGEAIWDVKPAQVYTTLARLEEAGLVMQKAVGKDGGPEKRIYGVTAAGRDELAAWLQTAVPAEHERDESFIKLMLSLSLEGADPYRVIREQRTALYRELHRVTGQRQEADPGVELATILLLDKVVMHLEADLRWLDMVESRLEDVRRQPRPEPVPKPRGRPRRARLHVGRPRADGIDSRAPAHAEEPDEPDRALATDRPALARKR